jgi:hypothetical protein
MKSRTLRLFFGASLAGALSLGACTFDPDDRCGEHQVIYGDNLRCVCEEGYAWTEGGCVACGEHEVAGPAGCLCEDGYARPTPDAPCEMQAAALGAPCDEANACADPVYSYCEPDAGYCTESGCESSADCEGGYACDTESEPTVCRRPPLGVGKSCSSDADCAGTEATFCDLVVSRTCLVQGCTVEPNDCFEGYICCDLTPFVPAPICIPGASCSPP